MEVIKLRGTFPGGKLTVSTPENIMKKNSQSSLWEIPNTMTVYNLLPNDVIILTTAKTSPNQIGIT